jgi:hypothetical protein
LRLPIVTCPSCATTHVRTRHPDAEFWRSTRKLIWAMGSLFIRIALLVVAGFAFAIAMMMIGYGFLYEDDPTNQRDDPSMEQLVLAVTVVGVLFCIPGVITRLVLPGTNPNRCLGILLLYATGCFMLFEYQNLYWAVGVYAMDWSYKSGYVLSIDAPLILVVIFGTIALINGLIIRIVGHLRSRIRTRLPSAWVRRRRRLRKKEIRIRERGFAT